MVEILEGILTLSLVSLGLVILYGIFSIVRLRFGRDKAYQAFCVNSPFEFKSGIPHFFGQFNHLDFFRPGSDHRFHRSVAKDEDGKKLILFDVDSRDQGESRYEHRTVGVVVAPDLDLPRFFLRHELPVIDAIGKVFGGQDINFPDDPEFSGSFVLQGKDEHGVREFFTPDLRRRLLPWKGRYRHIEGYRNCLLVDFLEFCPLENIEKLLTETLLVYDTLKTRVQ
jgi:hypothetical protein